MKKLKKVNWKKIIIIIVVIAIAVGGGIFAYKKLGKKTETVKTSVVSPEMGDITVSITGSGVIESNAEYEVTSLVKGEVLGSYFEEGDVVNAGDMLYSIDTKDIQNTIEKAKLSLEKSKNTYNEAIKDEEDKLKDLKITSTVSGVVTEVPVKVGDNVSGSTKIMVIKDTKRLKLTIPFVAENASNINVGDGATVILTALNDSISGTVSKISSGEITSSLGTPVRNVEITVDNPGAIVEGDEATAIVNGYACSEPGAFEAYSNETVVPKSSGQLEQVNYSVGDNVSAGALVASIKNTGTTTSLENQRLSIQDAELSLSGYYEQMEDYKIKSPISGTIVSKEIKTGDILDTSNSKVVMATIVDLSRLVFTMDVDELDISSIEIGQEVQVTADALPEVNFTGYIDNISILGTSANGVTTYPVTVVLNAFDGLIPGMNVNAEIITEKKENVIKVPVSAVKRGNTVMVEKDGKTAPQKVEVGIANSDYIEIVNGLTTDDKIVITETADTTTTNQGGMMGGGMMGGGAPPQGGGGGAPQGGGQSRGGASK